MKRGIRDHGHGEQFQNARRLFARKFAGDIGFVDRSQDLPQERGLGLRRRLKPSVLFLQRFNSLAQSLDLFPQGPSTTPPRRQIRFSPRSTHYGVDALATGWLLIRSYHKNACKKQTRMQKVKSYTLYHTTPSSASSLSEHVPSVSIVFACPPPSRPGSRCPVRNCCSCGASRRSPLPAPGAPRRRGTSPVPQPPPTRRQSRNPQPAVMDLVPGSPARAFDSERRRNCSNVKYPSFAF